jgi:hypothetical protein
MVRIEELLSLQRQRMVFPFELFSRELYVGYRNFKAHDFAEGHLGWKFGFSSCSPEHRGVDPNAHDSFGRDEQAQA